jgi:hypothetical protein
MHFFFFFFLLDATVPFFSHSYTKLRFFEGQIYVYLDATFDKLDME